MGKKPKKLPITATPLPTTTKAEPTHANPHRRRKLSTTARINQFHALAKKLAQVRKAGGNLLEEQDLQLQIDALGGLHAYQRASLKGGDERSGRGACGKWLVGFLGPLKEELVQAGLSHQKKNKKSDADNESTPVIKLLDIGALNGETYSKQSKWIHAQYIDLNPQHANVIAQDFFLRPIPTVPADYFHVVCLSLVVNFVDDPERRGIMLMHARKFLLPKGLLFLVLPLPCTANSRYMNHERLKEICIAIGFEEIEFHATKRLSYHLWRRVEDSEFAPTNVDKKMVNDGPGRNNFSIIVKINAN
ncbi:putative methyltransferase-domain-containing protein [Obelidium mucronatum]|nr:putative methyltransferase-domain-containing protein [Obelidium mucronatum]